MSSSRMEESGSGEDGGLVGGGLSPLWQNSQPRETPTRLGKATKLSSRHASRSLSSLDKRGRLWSKFYAPGEEDERVRRVLEVVREDQAILSDPAHNHRRRTLILERRSGAERLGLTLSTYELSRGSAGWPVEVLRYVSNVEMGGAAEAAGLRAGDVIIGLDGVSAGALDQEALEELLRRSLRLRLVLLWQDLVGRVELATRALKLPQLLRHKTRLLASLEAQEARLLSRFPHLQPPLPDLRSPPLLSVPFPLSPDASSLYFSFDSRTAVEPALMSPPSLASSTSFASLDGSLSSQPAHDQTDEETVQEDETQPQLPSEASTPSNDSSSSSPRITRF